MDLARRAHLEPGADAPRTPLELEPALRGAAIFAAVLAVGCLARFGATGEALLGAFFAAVLLVLTAYDLVQRRIPNRIVLPAAVVLLLGHVWLDPGRTVEFILAALLAGLFLLLPLFIYPAGMGMGDVKMALLLGAGLGSAVAAALFVGLFASFFAALWLLLTRGRAARKTAIPFAPFLAFGGLVALFFS